MVDALVDALEEELYDAERPGKHAETIRRLEDYLERDKQDVRDHVSKYLTNPGNYEPDLDARVSFHPYRIYIADRYDNIMGEVRGIYDPRRNRWIFTPSSDRSVRVHEVFHKAQEELGLLRGYDDPRLIEGMATLAAEEITGERQLSYPMEKEMTKEFVRKHGWDRVLEGRAPAMMN